ATEACRDSIGEICRLEIEGRKVGTVYTKRRDRLLRPVLVLASTRSVLEPKHEFVRAARDIAKTLAEPL
ncbi:MAG: hypothetical protein ACI8TX_002507, partial [Hyphomicrobiaceae bacterium]